MPGLDDRRFRDPLVGGGGGVRETLLEALAGLRPVFRDGGVVKMR